MEYSKLVAVTGLPGLYELINSKTDGAIVRSLDDNSTRFASSRIHNFSHLESIEVFTTGDNVNLVEIFHAMEKAGAAASPDTKDNTVVKKYFEKTYPELDFERVYPSDLKKMIKWFEVLKKNNIEIKLSEPPVEEEQPEEALVKEEPKEKPAKKEAVKKEEAKEEKQKKKEGKAKAEEEKPKKKTASKKEEETPKKKPAAKPARPKDGKK